MNNEIPAPAQPEQGGYTFSFQRWMESFLRVILRVALVVGLALLAVSVLSIDSVALFVLYALMYILVLVANFAPLPYRARAGIFTAVFYVLGIAGLIEYGIRGDSRLFFVVYSVMATLFFGWKSSITTIGLILLAGVTFGYLIISGTIDMLNPVPRGDFGAWLVAFVEIALIALMLNFGLRQVFQEFLRAQQKAELTVSLLSEERAGLEARVEERTEELERKSRQSEKQANQLRAISEVVQQATLEKDIEKMLPNAAGSISEKLGFYHVGIFLLDEQAEHAILRAASSPGGQKMLARQHKIRIGGAGIVSFAVTMNRPRIALDVSSDAYFAQNPDLPETRAEMALPLSIGERVLGVLDVQSSDPNAFTEQDIGVMKTLADQLALAIENIRLLAETRQALAEVESLYREYLSSRWGQSGQDLPLGYRYHAAGVAPLQEPVDRPEILEAARSGNTFVEPNGPTAVAIPVKVRDQVVGILNIRSGRSGKIFSEEDMDFLRSISERVGLSLENARLFNAAQKRAVKERMIGSISTRISESSDIDSILQTAAEEIGRALVGSEVVVQLATE